MQRTALLLAILALAAHHLHAAKNAVPPVPSMVIVKADTPPVIDGNLALDEWKQSTAISGFCTAGRSMAARQPVAHFTYDDQFLYFAVVSAMDAGEVLRANLGVDDERLICMDDSIELYYQPAPEKEGLETYYQVLFNSRGAVLDNAAEPFGQNNLQWNSHLVYHSTVTNNLWTIEGKIPWSSYRVTPADLKKPGQRLNICRNGLQSFTSWSWTMSFANLGRAGNVSFESGIPAVKVLDMSPLLAGKGKVGGQIGNASGQPAAVHIALEVNGTKVEETVNVPPGDTADWQLDAGEITGTTYVAALKIVDSANGNVYLDQTLPVDVTVKKQVNTTAPLPVGFKAGYSRISNAIGADLDIYHFPEKLRVRTAALQVFEDRDGARQEVGLQRVAAFPKGVAHAAIYLTSDYAPGKNTRYVTRLTLLDGQNNALFTEDRELFVKSFAWEDNAIGVSDDVLSPFTPLQVKGSTVECWNRSYVFSGDGLLGNVTAGAETVISRPMRFAGHVDGKDVQSLPAGEPTVIESKPHQVVLQGRGTIGDTLDYAVRSKMDYDGMVAFCVTLQPRRPVRVTALTLAIPINTSVTRYLNATGDYVRKNAICGPLKPDQGPIWSSLQHPNMKVKGSFIPFLWLSNDQNGLCWVADSDRGWQLDFKKAALDLVRQGDTVMLNLNVINKPVTLGQPVSFEFILQATPVKPMIKGWRTAGIGGGNPDSPPQDNAFQFFWFNWGTPGRWTIDSMYEKAVAAANRNGARSCIYNNWSAFPYSLNSVDKEAVNSFIGDWDGAVMVGSVQDCVLHYADKMLAEGKIGGLYCDDTWPQASMNVLNQSAYILPDGEIQPGFGILRQRDYARRVAHMLERHGKRPGLWLHDTHGLIVPYLAFADISMDGEDHPLTDIRPDFIDNWPFERLRAGAMGTKLGTIPFWLPLVRAKNTEENREMIVKLSRTMLGPLLLHDYITYYTWASLDNGAVLSVQKAKSDFGIGDDAVTFHPYWNNAGYVTATPEAVLVSFYRNGRTLLLTALNQSDGEVSARITLDFKQLGILNPVVTRTETGEPIPLAGSTIELTIPYHDFVLLRVGEMQ